MSQKFQASVHHRDDVSFVKLGGVIDEDNELNEQTEKIPSGTVVIDLGEVERINSCGVRDWVNWLSSIEAKNAEVVLVECSPAIVAQINLVNNFTGNGTVKSFYVPYFCPECDEEKVLLCDVADMGPPPHEPPVCRCDECDLVMDFDDMPDSYFAFLASQKKIAKPEKVQSVLNEFQHSREDKSRIRSRVGATSLSGNPSSASLPTVPTLPTPAGSQPSIITSPPGSTPAGLQQPGLSSSRGSSAATAKSGMVVYVLVAVLLAAVGVLAFLVFSGN